MVTFKKSEDLRAIARDVPLDRILVETDAPYLAPTPHRGRRNEPAFVVSTASVVAEARGITLEALADATRANTHAIFSRLPPASSKLPQPLGNTAAGCWVVELTLRLTILGCGSSGGVPRVGQGWGACDPANPEEPPPPMLDARRTLRRRTARPRFSSTPRPICASS